MKIQLNSINFYDDISPQEEIIDSNESSTKLIPFGKSGIHIKKENRGSFTSYCGGKVTDACIQKGKNSPSAAIRKKATFAANARKWKHQFGGTLVPNSDKLIPMSTRTDISDLFVDYDTPSNFTLKNLKKAEEKEDELNISDNLDYYFGTTPLSTTVVPEEDETPVDETTTVYTGNDSPTQVVTDPQQQGFKSSRLVDFSTLQNIPDDWREVLNRHLGKQGGVMGSWDYDCSNFVSRVYRDRGIRNLWGNCRTLYANTDHSSDYSQAQLGDLIFFKGTQKKERGLGPDQPSHVAIVLDTSRLPEGFITVAQGSPETKTHVRELNLNQGYYHDHYLGIGKVRVPIARSGIRFQFGGIVPKHVADLFVSTESPKKKYTPMDYSILFKENEESNKENKPLDFLTFLTQDIQERRQTTQQKQEEPPETFVYQQPEEQFNKEITYSGSRYNFFKSEFDKYAQRDPSAKQFEPVLTRIAKHESNFNLTVQNSAGAPAYGWFQFWQDGKTNNITHYSGLDVNSFVQNPQAQISSAIKLAKDILRSFTAQDYQLAQSKGYNKNALIRGAWLGGVGGVRQVLNGTGNPNDSKWYGGKGGRSVKQAMDDEKNLTTNT